MMISVLCGAQAPVPEPATDQETELGQEVYNELRDKGEIVEFLSALCHFETDSQLDFSSGPVTLSPSLQVLSSSRKAAERFRHAWRQRLCRGFSAPHTIHRDSISLMEKRNAIKRHEIEAAILLGPTRAHILAIALLGDLHSLGYSREAELNADITGSDICAEAGYNPWGLVWLFDEFQHADTRQIPQLLSDHPANGTRIETLKKHFRDNPDVFAKFNSDPKSATPFNVPKDAAEQFLRSGAN